MTAKRELELAKEYLEKRLFETKDALTIPFKTKQGDDYLRKKIKETEKAISLMETLIETQGGKSGKKEA